jgi:quercetin dioxygenase-like cupin family protein
MNNNAIFIKHGDEKTKSSKPGKLYRLMVKSDNLEAIIAELDPHTESRWFQHGGEEFHLVLEGQLEYIVGDHSYKLNEGDILWHKSTLKHRARNTNDEIVKYITIGTPPTFSMSML